MKFLPVALNIAGKKILVVGGGAVALQKIKTLGRFTKNIVVTAPRILGGIRRVAAECRLRPFTPRDLKGVSLVYACTDDGKLNASVVLAARKRKIPVNVADDPANCDFISPAIYKTGCLSVAVSSDGKNVKKSVATRDIIEKYLRGRSR
jgi:siroheme synthase-like protein